MLVVIPVFVVEPMSFTGSPKLTADKDEVKESNSEITTSNAEKVSGETDMALSRRWKKNRVEIRA